MGVGYTFTEDMAGSWRRPEEEGGKRKFSFHFKAEAESLLRHLRDGKMTLVGHVEMEGFAERKDAVGVLTLNPWVARFVRYQFDFVGDDGRPYRFDGQKTIRHLSPMRTWTYLPGAVYDAEGKVVAKCELRFLPEMFLPFIRTWKLART